MRTTFLKWSAILSPLIFVAFLEFAGYVWRPRAESAVGRMWVDISVLSAALIVSAVIYLTISRTTRRLARQNRELLALHDAGLDVAAELGLETVLGKVVEGARLLVGTRFGALSVTDANGAILNFITSGIDDETRARIPELPRGRGLLGVPLFEGERLRVERIGSDARSVGFPENHPPMTTLLAVPIDARESFRGNLYLSDKEDGTMFDDEDENTLARFATYASIAINNASLHNQVGELAIAQERQRIAHEMHDGLAQLLGYVNTKAQAARGFLERGDLARSAEQLDELAVAARGVYNDVRESIVGLRTLPETDKSFAKLLEGYVDQWGAQTEMSVQMTLAVSPRLAAPVELQLIRILQESLANVRKHSKASRVTIRLEETEGNLVLQVEDDGIGFVDPERRTGEIPKFGLKTMKERAESVGGSLEVEGRPGEGTTVTFRRRL